jgi:hypothetical protein
MAYTMFLLIMIKCVFPFCHIFHCYLCVIKCLAFCVSTKQTLAYHFTIFPCPYSHPCHHVHKWSFTVSSFMSDFDWILCREPTKIFVWNNGCIENRNHLETSVSLFSNIRWIIWAKLFSYKFLQFKLSQNVLALSISTSDFVYTDQLQFGKEILYWNKLT